MADRALRTVTRAQGANVALLDGSVRPAGFDLDFVDVPVLVHGFRRMVRELEFDVSEMALTTYLVAKAHGVRFTALPIFLVRGFHHGATVVDPAAGIDRPEQLTGRRIGVNRGYTVTTGVWARGVLSEQYGLDLATVEWVLSGDEHVAQYRPPANVVPMPAGADLAALVRSGDLAAAIGIEDPGLTPLIPAPEEAGLAALRERRHYPINHLVVVRDELLEAHPDLAGSVFDAFAEAKRRYVGQLRDDTIASPTSVDRSYRRVLEQLSDPLPYGIEPNRDVLEELLDHAVAQHILTERPDVDHLFAASTRTLTA